MKEKKFDKNKSAGITLIALVVTIIVLLILAGISVQMLTGENGILTRAGEAKNNTEESQIKEKINLAYHSALAANKGNISEDLFVKELTEEFGTRNEKYTLINSKDGKSWIISINGTNVKENITKPANLQTEPINPEVEYGYAGKPGVVDASSLAEGDIINYYYDKEKEPISCAVLFNDKKHGLQVVSLDSVREVVLGNDKINIEPKTAKIFENGEPIGYEISEYKDIYFQKSRWSYNHTFQILKEYAMEYMGDMAINAKCIGASDTDVLEESKNTNMYKVSEELGNLSTFKDLSLRMYNDLIRDKDSFYLNEELDKMKTLGILQTQKADEYWIPSRLNIEDVTNPDVFVKVQFCTRFIKENGEIDSNYLLAFGFDVNRKKYVIGLLGRSKGFRPTFLLRDDISVERTGQLD